MRVVWGWWGGLSSFLLLESKLELESDTAEQFFPLFGIVAVVYTLEGATQTDIVFP